MLRSRIIPCLLLHKKGLVKTIRFGTPKYIGDPINAVKIFNEKEVDELIVLDIDATVAQKEPDYSLIEKLAIECRMPFCYGGGIKNVEQALKIIKLGVEKIALSSSIIEMPNLVSELAQVIGRQSIVVVLDIKKSLSGNYEIYTHNGKNKTELILVDFVRKIESLGAGEIIINSIDKDGTMSGYDYSLLEKVRASVNVPLTALGGAGSLDDIKNLINSHGIIGTAAGSLFVFKGIYKAVLINYPTPSEILNITSILQSQHLDERLKSKDN